MPISPTNLRGVDGIRFPHNPVLKFSHPHPMLVKNPLYVRSGANSIKWAYHLNTKVTPTYGGEVVQILSCFVGPITIAGQTMGKQHPTKHANFDANYTPNEELQEIVNWFLTYMHIAGTLGTSSSRRARDERAILFEYPERGWSFYIQPTGLRGFKYAVEQISAPWEIDAEIVSDNDRNYFSVATLEQFTDVATSNQLLSRMQRFANIGFDPNSPWISPAGSDAATADLKRFGNNFQALLGAWASGDFAHWGFAELTDAGQAALSQGTRDYWTNLLGADFINVGDATAAAGSIGGPKQNETTGNAKLDLVLHISEAFKAKGLTGDVGVATAMQESGLNPDEPQQGCDQPACGIGLFQVNGDGSGRGNHRAAIKAAGLDRSHITKHYPAGLQIQDAADWFAEFAAQDFAGTKWASASDETKAQLAYQAQHPLDESGYIAIIKSKLPDARSLISKAESAAKPAPGSAAGVVAYAEWAYANRSGIFYREIGGEPYPANTRKLPITCDCSFFAALCYKDAKLPDPNGLNYASRGNTTTLQAHGRAVPLHGLQPGDLLFFDAPAHVGVYVGGGYMIDHGGPDGFHPRKYLYTGAGRPVTDSRRYV